jgi:hypothetical protein
MPNARVGDYVTARCGTQSVAGIVVGLERGAFWVETTDGMLLRFALLPVCEREAGEATSH